MTDMTGHSVQYFAVDLVGTPCVLGPVDDSSVGKSASRRGDEGYQR